MRKDLIGEKEVTRRRDRRERDTRQVSTKSSPLKVSTLLIWARAGLVLWTWQDWVSNCSSNMLSASVLFHLFEKKERKKEKAYPVVYRQLREHTSEMS